MKVIIIIVLSLVTLFHNVYSQQVPVFNLNTINPYSLNPSYTGYNGSSAFLHYRKQWIGFDRAPESGLLSANWKLNNDKSGLGILILNDKNNILANTSGKISYAQYFKISKTQELLLGVNLGVKQNRILFENIQAQDESDEVLLANNLSKSYFESDFGLTYKINELTAQLIVPQLLGGNSTFNDTYNEKTVNYTLLRHFVGIVDYEFNVGEHVQLSPIIQLRGVAGLPFQYDAMLKTVYQDQTWVVVGYSPKNSFAVSVGTEIDHRFTIGYSAEFSVNNLAAYNSGTHEVVLGIKFKDKSNAVFNDKELKAIKKDIAIENERSSYITQKNEALQKEIEGQREKLENYIFGLEELKKENEKNKEELFEIIKTNQTLLNKNSNTETRVDNLNNENQNLKMTNEFYVIVSAFKDIKNVKRMQQILKAEYQLETGVIENKKGSWYFVYSTKTNNKDEANSNVMKIKQLDKKGLIITPWVYLSNN